MFLLFFYTCRSARLNTNGCMRKQECIKCYNVNDVHAFTNDLLSSFSSLRDRRLATHKLSTPLRSSDSPEPDFLRNTCKFCLKAVFPHFLQRSLSLAIAPSSGTWLKMKTYAHYMNLPLQSETRWKYDIECFTEYQTRYTWHKPSNLNGSWAHE